MENIVEMIEDRVNEINHMLHFEAWCFTDENYRRIYNAKKNCLLDVLKLIRTGQYPENWTHFIPKEKIK